MKLSPLRFALFAVAAVLPASASAQIYASAPPPLYPYELQPGQPYAVEVAPGTYVIHGSTAHQPVPSAVHAPPTSVSKRPHKPVDRGLVEELRRRMGKGSVVNTTKIVRDKPIVIEHRRVVEDPPRVIERKHYVGDEPATDAPPPPLAPPPALAPAGPPKKGKTQEWRIIHAEAEVTILGPDRMSIRLWRKGTSKGPWLEKQ